MATDSDGKLTKFESSVTVVTSDFANSIFGGLYGSGEGQRLDSDDPRVRGHVHDGSHVNGHAGKIDLVEHVENQLININLADAAVLKRNIWKGEQEFAIPEYSVTESGDIDPNGYYLDLRFIRSDFTFHEIETPDSADSDITEQRLIRQRKDDDADPSSWDDTYGYDFVFGSESLEDLNSGTLGDNRLQFDKSKGAIRAGGVEADQWDEANRGSYSTAFGLNNTASGNRSTIGGGKLHEASGSNSTVSGGDSNTASDTNTSVGGGYNNEASAIRATIAGGYSNTVSSSGGAIGGGTLNVVEEDSEYSFVGGGHTNEVTDGSTYSSIVGGASNDIGASGQGEPCLYSFVGGGHENSITGNTQKASIVGGYGNYIDGTSTYGFVGGGHVSGISASTYSAICGGYDSDISEGSDYSFIGGGKSNDITDGSAYSVVCGGQSNDIGISGTMTGGSDYSFIGGGILNDIKEVSTHSAISGGYNNSISGASTHSAISGGYGNEIVDGSTYSAISGGYNNKVGDGTAGFACSYSHVGGGSTNEILDGSSYSFIGSGLLNKIGLSGEDSACGYSVVVGGGGNTVLESSPYSAVVGGQTNLIVDTSPHSFIGGGEMNDIGVTLAGDGNAHSVIGGGYNNNIYGGSTHSFIGGGTGNDIAEAATHSAITGGDNNNIYGGSTYSFVGGGTTNNIAGSASYSAISGGTTNSIYGAAAYSTIGGGTTNNIHTNALHSTIGGGTTNTVSAVDSTIGGGSGNTVSAGGGSVSGGVSNTVSGINAVIGGGTTNVVSALNSTIAGGNSSQVKSDHSFVGGGEDNYIGEFSNHSVIAGGGGTGMGNSINKDFSFGTVPFAGVLGATCGATPSWNSGIFAGMRGSINGGGAGDAGAFPLAYGPRAQNYIMGGDSNHIGAGPTTSASYCSMLFGTQNEIVALGFESNLNRCHIGLGNKNWIYKNEVSSIDNMIIMSGTENVAYTSRPISGTIGNDIEDCIIVSGTKNRMYVTGQEGPIEGCMILGGHSNAFDSGGWDTVLVDGIPDPGGLGQGAQASSILGGSQNNIISTSGLDFFPNPTHPTDTTICRTVVSTIVGGFVNKIEGSHGSVICGGGAVIENDLNILSEAWEYGTRVHSGVTETFGTPGGVSDLLVPPYIPLGAPVSDSAQYHSGGNEINSAHYCGILSGTENIISDVEWSSISHGRGNLVEEVKEHEPNSSYDPVAFASANGKLSHSYSYGQASQASGELQTSYLSSIPGGNWPADVVPGVHGGGVGSAQTFVLTMFGHWDYSYSDLVSPGPVGTAYECYLEGHDFSSAGPSFKFIPRTHSTYVFKIMGTLQCTDAITGRTQHTIAFSYNGGIACDGDGSFSYNATDIVKHFGNPTVTNDNSVGTKDFNIYFSHLGKDDLATLGGPGPDYTDRAGSGDLYIGTSVTPPQGLFITVENVSGNYITSSLVARIEMAECRLQFVTSAF